MPIAPAGSTPDLSPTVLALDVGGTKLAGAIVDRDGSISGRTQAPTPVSGDAEEVFAALVGVAEATLASGDRERLVACGVGSGGPMEGGGWLGGTPRAVTVTPLNIPGWTRFPLAARVAEATGLVTFLDNDAKALALGEGWRGAAVGERSFLAMVVSTGVGGGLVLDGRLLDGRSGNAGHVGHVVVEPGGARCICGARGCLEAEVSGTAIARSTGGHPADAPPAVVARAGRLVGRAVGSVCNLLDLRLALVAGSVALGYGAPFFAAAQAELDATSCIEFARGATIRPAGLGDAGPLVGAAAVAWRGMGERLWD